MGRCERDEASKIDGAIRRPAISVALADIRDDMNEYLLHAPTIISTVGIGADTNGLLSRHQRHSAKLKRTFLSIVKTDETSSGSCGKPTRSVEAPRSIVHAEQEYARSPGMYLTRHKQMNLENLGTRNRSGVIKPQKPHGST